ncbi:unnamed protein product [Ectocarpus sp. 6 AP-2014]
MTINRKEKTKRTRTAGDDIAEIPPYAVTCALGERGVRVGGGSGQCRLALPAYIICRLGP